MSNTGREEVSGAHDARLPAGFLELMGRGWRDDGVDLAPVEHLEQLARRRAQLSAAFPGETLVVPTGAIRSRTFGAPYPFRGGSDFLWLTGDQEPDSVLVLHAVSGGHDAVLYARPRSDASSGAQFLNRMDGEIWHGRRYSPKEKAAVLGIETRPLGELAAVAGSLAGPVRVLRGYDDRIDRALLPLTDETAQRDALLACVLGELRLVKDDWEIAQLRDAVDASVLGFEDVARLLPPDAVTSERVVEGAFGWRARVSGNAVGYSSVVGGGPRSAVLHWARNDGVIEPGGVVLLDMGVENRNCYTADLTRVLPVSGTFSPAQRAVYDIVYASRQAGLAKVAPGAAFREIHLACMRVLAEGLADLGVLPTGVDEAMDPDCGVYRRWTLHGFGHMLGLDVHDCGHARPGWYGDGELRERHVLTMEPGLYFQPNDELVPAELRGVGVRLEDDVLVTAGGHEVLSRALPTDADGIEAWLAAQRAAGPRVPRASDTVG